MTEAEVGQDSEVGHTVNNVRRICESRSKIILVVRISNSSKRRSNSGRNSSRCSIRSRRIFLSR